MINLENYYALAAVFPFVGTVICSLYLASLMGGSFLPKNQARTMARPGPKKENQPVLLCLERFDFQIDQLLQRDIRLLNQVLKHRQEIGVEIINTLLADKAQDVFIIAQ